MISSLLAIFILLGQYGAVTSAGMIALAERLKPYGQVSIHSWDDNGVVSRINGLPSSRKIALVGFSLGASQIAFISANVHRQIDLAVAYDPSRQSPINGMPARKVSRLLCYKNSPGVYSGGACPAAGRVEVTAINEAHLSVQFDEALHRKTIAAVAALR